MRRLLIRRISICLVVSHDCAVTQHISSFGLLTLHLGATPCSTRQSRCNIGICSRPRRAQLMMTVVGSLSSSCSTLAPSEDQDCAMWTESSLECSAAASAAVAVAWGGLVRGPVSSGGHCRRAAAPGGGPTSPIGGLAGGMIVFTSAARRMARPRRVVGDASRRIDADAAAPAWRKSRMTKGPLPVRADDEDTVYCMLLV